MSRARSTILRSLIARFPTGFALARRNDVTDELIDAAAASIATVEASAEALMAEIDPRTARALLPDFERVLGPDPCGRDRGVLSVPERQRIAHQRWTAIGGQSIPYLISVAAKLGVRIEIEEFWPSKAGRLRAGQRLRPEGCQFVWRVKLAPIGAFKFRAGSGHAGNPLGWIILSGIECELRRIAHSHTTVVFSYTLEPV